MSQTEILNQSYQIYTSVLFLLIIKQKQKKNNKKSLQLQKL